MTKIKEIEDLKANLSIVNRSSGASRKVDDFPLLEMILNDTGEYPSIMNFYAHNLREIQFLESLKKSYPKMETVFEEEQFFEDDLARGVSYIKIQKGYYMEVMHLQTIDPNLYEMTEQEKEDDYFGIQVRVMVPREANAVHDPDFKKKFVQLIQDNVFKIISKPDAARIGMLTASDGEFQLKSFFLEDEYDLVDADLHYGEGFTEFNTSLMEKIKESTKGLVLLYGDPGTGKTYYIRSALRSLAKMGKFVVYIPPSLVESMTDPTLIDFIQDTATAFAEEGVNCVLLIEDAEPLLASAHGRTAGITNLLNFTDGIYNDILKVQVIATFNTKTVNIDSALMREERLIAEKEFTKLDVEDATVLCKKLKIDFTPTESMSLAEIYSKKKKSNILRHGKKETKKLGF